MGILDINEMEKMYFWTNLIIVFQYRESGQSAWVYFITEKIPAEATSFVMRNLTANTTYLIKLAAKNE